MLMSDYENRRKPAFYSSTAITIHESANGRKPELTVVSQILTVSCSILLHFGLHMKSKKIKGTFASFGVVMALGDAIVFLVYS